MPALIVGAAGFAYTSISRYKTTLMGHFHSLLTRYYDYLVPTITLNISLSISTRYFVLIMISIIITLHLIVHYWIWQKYSRLTPVEDRIIVPFEVPPETIGGDDEDPIRTIKEQPPGPVQTPEEYYAAFLSSIRVFGFLEKKVFKSLLKHLHECSLETGQQLEDSDRSFYVVVDGKIQLRLPVGRIPNQLAEAPLSQDNHQDDKDQVLTEIGPGGTVSSLFDILSIFTESDRHPRPSVTAVAVEPTTLMVIPEKAFAELRETFPTAATHIVHVVLARFQRVTFLTLHRYLGLSSEVVRIEKSLNSRASPVGIDPEDKVDGWPRSKSSVKTFPDSLLDEAVLDKAVLTDLVGREAIQRQTFDRICTILGIPQATQDVAALWQAVELQVSKAGTQLVRQGDRNTGLFYLVKGSVLILSGSGGGCEIRDSGIANIFASVIGNYSLSEIRVKCDSIIGHVDKRHVDWLVERHPTILLRLAGALIQNTSPLVRSIDLALDWMHISGGQVLCRQGQPATNIYIVLHGRVRGILEERAESRVIAEFGAGESIGEMEVLAEAAWPGTFHAIRDTEIACMPRLLFSCLARLHPSADTAISRILATKYRQSLVHPACPLATMPFNMLRTIAILPVDPVHLRVVREFVGRLSDELAPMGSCVLLDTSAVVDALGKHVFTAIGKLRLVEWLNQQEDCYRTVLYLADSVRSPWTRRCIRQADCIFLVGLADGDSRVGPYERLLFDTRTTARKELVLLHRVKECPSGLTRQWLENRPWIIDHLHIYLPPTAAPPTAAPPTAALPTFVDSQTKLTNPSSTLGVSWRNSFLWQLVVDQFEKYNLLEPSASFFSSFSQLRRRYPPEPNHSASSEDFARLARRILGRSIGLVLSGGGARGFAHVGVIQALCEAGIPVDLVGGTSMGAFVGALFARDVDALTLKAFVKAFSARMSSYWRVLIDLTYPITAWLTGHAFNRNIWKALGDRMLEDMWLPFFCVSTNITHSKMALHRSGYAWRFVRASMSLSGFLPPICDSGNMLVDGGYINNLPVDVMLRQFGGGGVSTIIAVDVSSEDDTSPADFGDTVSGWWILFLKLLGIPTKVPTLADIQARLAYVSCVEKLEAVKRAASQNSESPTIFYLRPQVQHFGTIEFSRMNAIFAAGYQFAVQTIANWKADGTFERVFVQGIGRDKDQAEMPKKQRLSRPRRLSL